VNPDRISIADAEQPMARLRQLYNTLAESLNAKMSSHDLLNPFGAQLITALGFNATGGAKSGALSSPPSSATTGSSGQVAAEASGSPTQTQPVGYVAWESEHFFADVDRHLGDVSINGRFGFQPALAIVQPAASGAATGAPAPSTLTASYQQAFQWDMSPRWNLRSGDIAETSLFARLGQSVLTNDATLVEPTTNTQLDTRAAFLAVPVDNSTGRAAVIWEVGTEFHIFGRSLDILHTDGGTLSPMFGFAAGFRNDSRFRAEGPLAAYTNPQRRVFFRFLVDALQVVTADHTSPQFTVGIAVDYERAAGGSGLRVPSGTRIVLRGDLKILQAIRGEK
jgi:hypothetical protein